MYNAVGKKYGFDHGEKHDFGEAQKHLNVEAFKLKVAEKSLKKQEAEIIRKEQELAERAKDLEPDEHISCAHTVHISVLTKSLENQGIL